MRRRGSGVDEVPKTLPAEDRQGRGDAVENALDVDVDHVLPLLDAQVVERGQRPDAGISDKNVELAVTLRCQGDECGHIGAPSHIRDQIDGFSTGFGNASRKGFEPIRMESLFMGCVGFSQRYFPDGKISTRAFKEAELAAATELQTIVHDFTPSEWKQAVGSSGTARSIAEVLEAGGVSHNGITAKGMAWIKEKLLAAGDVRKLELQGCAMIVSLYLPAALPSCRRYSTSLA